VEKLVFEVRFQLKTLRFVVVETFNAYLFFSLYSCYA